jgi:hypothetical protein
VTTYRVTRLIVRDQIPVIAVPRDWIVRRLESTWAHSLGYLLECEWCMSVWVGAAVVATTTHYTSVRWPWLVWAGASAFTGFLAQREPD